MPGPKKGKRLPVTVTEAVIDFYVDDEFSRLLPGKSDTISIGHKQHKQKRLLLRNLKELKTALRDKH